MPLYTLLISNMKHFMQVLKNLLEINQISLIIKMFIKPCSRQSLFFLHKQYVACCILYGLKSNGHYYLLKAAMGYYLYEKQVRLQDHH